jgi:LacI family transcriptional regulator
VSEQRGRPVTLRDVAQLAGVHPSTASRILSGSRRGDPEAAGRVHKAAQTLGYRANRIARALRQQNTTTVGMVVPDLENPFFPALVKSIESALNREGYALLLCDAQDSPVVEAQRVDALLQRQVDGLILCPVDMRESVAAVQDAAHQVPVVQVDRRVRVSTDFVGVDQASVIALVADHLESIGRARIAFLTSADSVSTVAERSAAYRRRFADNVDSRDRIQVGALTLRWGIEAVSAMLAAGEKLPDALLCANDLIALGAMQRLRQAGIRVPDDVAVTGVDDTAFGQVSEPELTTVRQPIDQLGEEAVAMLLSRLREPHSSARRERAARTLVLEPELLVRRSTQPTPAAVPATRTATKANA